MSGAQPSARETPASNADRVVWIDGRFTGTVQANTLIIGDHARFEGEIVAGTVIVGGNVRGIVRAQNIFLEPTARVEGVVFQNALTVRVGARLDGDCRRIEAAVIR